MANIAAWAAEGIQKSFIKTAGKGKMAWKTLGKKATKETAEEIGEETGKALAKVDAKRQARREVSSAYKRSVKEARNSGSDAAKEAIEKNAKSNANVATPNTVYDYRHYVKDGNEIFERRLHDSSDPWSSTSNVEYANARRGAHATSNEFTYEHVGSSDSLPGVIEASDVSESISKTGAGDGAGVNLWEFIEKHPVASAGIGVGGGFLLSEFLDED